MGEESTNLINNSLTDNNLNSKQFVWKNVRKRVMTLENENDKTDLAVKVMRTELDL
uniref:MADF domain-containing protein n=1 Tax=Meloidogyne hapla TaxID=6305 RepID=A0A1I8BHC6_MELHA